MPFSPIPIYLPNIDSSLSTAWPVSAAVPLPKDFEHINDVSLYCDDTLVPCGFEIIEQEEGGYEQLVIHIHFVAQYTAGVPAQYELREASSGMSESIAIDDEGKITVDNDTGHVFKFDNYGLTEVCELGERIIYDHTNVPAGTFCRDGREIKWTAKNGKLLSESLVEIECDTPAYARIRCSCPLKGYGGNQGGDDVAPFLTQLTWYEFWLGSPMVRVQHAIIFERDPTLELIRDLHIKIPVYSNTNVHWAHEGEFETLNHTTGVVSADNPDGVFYVEMSGKNLALYVRDLVEKHPRKIGFKHNPDLPSDPEDDEEEAKEKLVPDELRIYLWPDKQVTTNHEFTDAYKAPWAMDGEYLQTIPPGAAIEALDAYPADEIYECKPDVAAGGRFRGAWTCEYMLEFCEPCSAAVNALHEKNKYFKRRPVGMPSPQWRCDTGLIGKIAPVSNEFPEIEQYCEDALLSRKSTGAVAGYTGWVNHGDIPHRYNIELGRPDIHRNRSAVPHYQGLSALWTQVFRGGTQKVLDWARTTTDHYTTVQMNHSGTNLAGSFFHGKGIVPWGDNPPGYPEANSYEGSTWWYDDQHGWVGHFIDSTAVLFSYLFDVNQWSKYCYKKWLDAASQRDAPESGTRWLTVDSNRNAVNALGQQIFAWLYTGRESLKDICEQLADKLVEAHAVAVTQANGNTDPYWAPLWMNYTKDVLNYWDSPDFDDFLENFSQRPANGNAINLASKVLAYQLSLADAESLASMGTALGSKPGRLFRDPSSEYDLFGVYTQEDGQLPIQWGYFLHGVKEAELTSLSGVDEPGQYFHGTTSYTPSNTYGAAIYVLKDDSAWESLTSAVGRFESALYGARVRITKLTDGPTLIFDREMTNGQYPTIWRPSGEISAQHVWGAEDLEGLEDPGLYKVQYYAQTQPLFQRVSPFPEAAVIHRDNGVTGNFFQLASYVESWLVRRAPGEITLSFGTIKLDTVKNQNPRPVSVKLMSGVTTLVDETFLPGVHQSATITIDEEDNGPWYLSARGGAIRIHVLCDNNDPFVMSHNLDWAITIRDALVGVL